ncbi:hypothetical protein ACQEVC_23805 [Plantactinospora sp. CA-294935]|uniref:hypothetical protein n=1 Tax=Plantactinospora sp. CA-294935 TaxID=3240012 RepID=UPI003D92DE9F
MSWLAPDSRRLGATRGNVALLFVTAFVAFRADRTVAELAPFDFVAPVGVSVIVGRTATAFATAAATLVTMLLVHQATARTRPHPLLDRPVERLIDDRRQTRGAFSVADWTNPVTGEPLASALNATEHPDPDRPAGSKRAQLDWLRRGPCV